MDDRAKTDVIERNDVAELEPLLCSIEAACAIICRGKSFVFDAIARGTILAVMPRDGAIPFRDTAGKLVVLRVECDKCGRRGSYPLDRLIELRH
jgi:hypothetical protein